ncbi:MAG: hypothetical protein QF488_03180 [Candidatus Nitrosopelagicus sp.]|nr:hypothetical protein [Candidatus Nitrosopelagicus sp.]
MGIGTQSTFGMQTEYTFDKYGDASFEPIPEWIKNNAGWWAEGKIFDASFVAGIEWLITNGIITVSTTEQEAVAGYEIPKWIKNNAGWWAEGKIPDSEFISGLEWLIEHGIIMVNLPEDVDPYDITFAPILSNVSQQNLQYVTTTFFHVFGDLDSIQTIDEVKHWGAVYLGLNEDRVDEYNEVALWNDPQKVAVVFPTFTSAAYGEPGFYTYYRGECDECTTTNIKIPRLFFPSSGNAIQSFSLMGYKVLDDIEIDKNPSILEKYDKIIMLHNEYVTQTIFDAITNHPNVIYLYPNALYAEIEVDYEANLITLIRGHGYPDAEISNGFDWEFDNTHPYEYDTECSNMEFYRIDNGWMTNCYPEQVFTNSVNGTHKILKLIKEL